MKPSCGGKRRAVVYGDRTNNTGGGQVCGSGSSDRSVRSDGEDKPNFVGEHTYDCQACQAVDLQNFNRNLFCTEAAVVPYDQIHVYVHHIGGIDENTRKHSSRVTGIWGMRFGLAESQ